MINAAELIHHANMQMPSSAFCKHGLPSNAAYPAYGLAEHAVLACSGGEKVMHANASTLELDGEVIIVNNNKK